jgi:hypothetical protein
MQYQLICEGDCNGHQTDVLDREIQEAAKARGSGQEMTGDKSLWRDLRQLRHTPHVLVNDRAQCVVCGGRRRYGVSVSEVPEAEAEGERISLRTASLSPRLG